MLFFDCSFRLVNVNTIETNAFNVPFVLTRSRFIFLFVLVAGASYAQGVPAI
jgi:hypothetical protein